MTPTAERLTEEIARATKPACMGSDEALEVLEDVASWLEGSIEALKEERAEWLRGERENEP